MNLNLETLIQNLNAELPNEFFVKINKREKFLMFGSLNFKKYILWNFGSSLIFILRTWKKIITNNIVA